MFMGFTSFSREFIHFIFIICYNEEWMLIDACVRMSWRCIKFIMLSEWQAPSKVLFGGYFSGEARNSSSFECDSYHLIQIVNAIWCKAKAYGNRSNRPWSGLCEETQLSTTDFQTIPKSLCGKMQLQLPLNGPIPLIVVHPVCHHQVIL